MDQRSAEWFAARLGKLTASRVADMMARTKTGWSASRDKYLWQLAVERVTGVPEPSYCNSAMQWGIDTEADARRAYEQHALVGVTEVGFIDHHALFAGASPDGLIGSDGMLEIKCPETHTHGKLLLGIEPIPDRYIKQMQFQLACAGRAYCDFVSFDPRVPEGSQMFLKRVERDDKAIAEIEECAAEFLAEVDKIEAQFRARQPIMEAA
jgi:putative phage-type endonuclease